MLNPTAAATQAYGSQRTPTYGDTADRLRARFV